MVDISNDALGIALRCARGTYQRRLLMGNQRWSGSDLVGSARDWKARYYNSRMRLLRRMCAAGLVCREETRKVDGRVRSVLVVRVGL